MTAAPRPAPPRPAEARPDAPRAEAGARPRRRICLVIDRIAGRAGGAERIIVETANALARRGHLVEIVTHERTVGAPFYPLDFGVIHTNLRRPEQVRGRLRRRIDRLRESWHARAKGAPPFPLDHAIWTSKYGAFWRRLDRHLEANRPDVAIAFLPPAIVALGLTRPRFALRRIASLHNVPAEDLTNPARWDPSPLDRRRRMEALGRMDAVTVLLPEFRDWFEPGLRERVVIVPNPVRPISTARIRRHARQKTVMSVGRLAPVKRHGLLIEAWADLAPDFPDWRLKIFGLGPLKAELGALIRTRDLADKVLLMGQTDAIDDEYLAASILVHPAEHEGWGLAVTEAMAAGTPAIGFSDCPGVNQLIRDGVNGLLVEPGADRKAALVAALRALMGDEARREALAREAPRSVTDYAPDRIVDRWEALLG